MFLATHSQFSNICQAGNMDICYVRQAESFGGKPKSLEVMVLFPVLCCIPEGKGGKSTRTTA